MTDEEVTQEVNDWAPGVIREDPEATPPTEPVDDRLTDDPDGVEDDLADDEDADADDEPEGDET